MFRNSAAEFVYTRTYSRWKEDKQRRETWNETVERFINFINEERGDLIPSKVIKKIEKYMLSFDVMPSMRAVWAAGKAAKEDNTTIYNCSFQKIDSIDSFAECLYVLMCGTGYGFSVKKEDIENLPIVPKISSQGSGIKEIEDTKSGWADSIKDLMKSLYSGKDLEFDYSKLRKKRGAINDNGWSFWRTGTLNRSA